MGPPTLALSLWERELCIGCGRMAEPAHSWGLGPCPTRSTLQFPGRRQRQLHQLCGRRMEERVYEVQLLIFQGPLDLLLHLIEKRELDITKVSLLEVTEQYLERLQSMECLNLDAISDFLVVAAKLMLIKSLSLLPRPRQEEEDE